MRSRTAPTYHADMKALLILAALSFPLTSHLLAEDTPTTAPAATLIDATDKEAITANQGKQVTVEGKIASAKWSGSGKVLNIKFDNSPLMAVVFDRNKDKMNEAFGGDVAKALDGAKVKLKGKLDVYKGKVETLQGKPQIVITQSSQITIEEGGATTKASKSE